MHCGTVLRVPAQRLTRTCRLPAQHGFSHDFRNDLELCEDVRNALRAHGERWLTTREVAALVGTSIPRALRELKRLAKADHVRRSITWRTWRILKGQ